MKFKLICIDDSYTGILNGNIFVSDSLTKEQLVRLTSGDVTAEEIIEIFNPKLSEIRESNREVQDLVDVLLDSGLFEEKNGSYYRVGNPISVPKMLLEKYKKILEEYDMSPELDALDNFWLKCSLNPSVDARENLFWFLDKWGFTITPKGYIVSYRNVNVKQEGNKELHDFIATNYTKIKGQKKAPKNYFIYHCEFTGYQLLKEKVSVSNWKYVGNLQDLYNNLADLSETVYTDQYSGKFNIKLGEPVKMPREQCDLSEASCSKGLHQGAVGWLKQNYFGSVGLVCLVNPMNVISIPKIDNYGKMRCCEYLPYGLIEWDENGDVIPVATDVFEDDYDVYTLEELNKLLQEVDSSNQVIHQLTFSEVPNQAYKTIDEYRTILESKNQSIYSDKDCCANYDEDGDCDEDDYDDDDYWDDEDDEDEEDNW